MQTLRGWRNDIRTPPPAVAAWADTGVSNAPSPGPDGYGRLAFLNDRQGPPVGSLPRSDAPRKLTNRAGDRSAELQHRRITAWMWSAGRIALGWFLLYLQFLR